MKIATKDKLVIENEQGTRKYVLNGMLREECLKAKIEQLCNFAIKNKLMLYCLTLDFLKVVSTEERRRKSLVLVFDRGLK